MDDAIFLSLRRRANVFKFGTENLLNEYFQAQGKNSFKSAELAQGNVTNFTEYATEKIRESEANNTACIFSSVSKDVTTFNANFDDVQQIENRLLKMHWRDFEYLSSSILETGFDAVDVRTTQSSGDGGVDFEGKILIGSSEAKLRYGEIEVYGQSKKYAGNVGIYDIKSFVAFANSKKRNYVHHPQIFMFFTTSEFASSALKEIEENGFIGLNRSQIALLIYNHRDRLLTRSEVIRTQVLGS